MIDVFRSVSFNTSQEKVYAVPGRSGVGKNLIGLIVEGWRRLTSIYIFSCERLCKRMKYTASQGYSIFNTVVYNFSKMYKMFTLIATNTLKSPLTLYED